MKRWKLGMVVLCCFLGILWLSHREGMLNGALVASAELQNDVQAINAETEAFKGNNTLHLSAGAGDSRRRLSETRAKNGHNDHIHVEGEKEKTAAQVIEANLQSDQEGREHLPQTQRTCTIHTVDFRQIWFWFDLADYRYSHGARDTE